MNIEKIIQAWERCEICNTSPIAKPEETKAYIECEYTTGLYCRRDKLIRDTIRLLKEQESVVRCKECKWWGTERLCENSDSPCFQNGCTHGNWFCADGERKEGR